MKLGQVIDIGMGNIFRKCFVQFGGLDPKSILHSMWFFKRTLKNSIINSFWYMFFYQQESVLLTTKLFCLHLLTFSEVVWSYFFNRTQDGSLLNLEIYKIKNILLIIFGTFFGASIASVFYFDTTQQDSKETIEIVTCNKQQYL